MGSLGPTELLIILGIILLIFGGAKLPQLARSLGQAQREFKQGTTDGREDDPSRTDPPRPDRTDTTPS